MEISSSNTEYGTQNEGHEIDGNLHGAMMKDAGWTYSSEQEIVVRELWVPSGRERERLPFRIDERLVCGVTCIMMKHVSPRNMLHAEPLTIMKPKPCQLRRVDETHEPHIICGHDGAVKLAFGRNGVGGVIKLGVMDVGGARNVNKVGLSMITEVRQDGEKTGLVKGRGKGNLETKQRAWRA